MRVETLHTSKAKTVKKKRRDVPLIAVCHDTIHEIMHEDLAGSLKKVCQKDSYTAALVEDWFSADAAKRLEQP